MSKIVFKIADSEYNSKSGLSWVRANTDLGSIVAYAQCHPEENNPSKFAGCEYAERRVYIKYLKKKRGLTEQRTYELTNAIKAIKDIHPTRETGKGIHRALRVLRDRLKRLIDEHRKLTLAIDSAEKNLKKTIEERPNKVKEILKKSKLRKKREGEGK